MFSQNGNEFFSQEVSPEFLKGNGGTIFLKNAQWRYALEYTDAYGFLDDAGLCLRSSLCSKAKNLLFLHRFEGRKFQEILSPELAANSLFYLRYAREKGTPLFRLFEHKIMEERHLFVVVFLRTPFLVETRPIIAFFAQHISSSEASLFLENEHEAFRRNEILRDIRTNRTLTPWAVKELLFLGLSPETHYITCFLLKGEAKDEQRRKDPSWHSTISRYLLRERSLFCWSGDRGLGILLPQKESTIPPREEQKNQALFLLELCKEIFPDQDFFMGLAAIPRPLSELCRSISEAERASRGALFGVSHKIIHFEEIGYGAFLDPENPEWLHFIEHTLGPLLLEEGEPPVLLQSLEALLEYSSISKAAKVLHVHSNTLSYRKRQIEELLQADLNDIHVRTNLLLALKARHLLENY